MQRKTKQNTIDYFPCLQDRLTVFRYEQELEGAARYVLGV